MKLYVINKKKAIIIIITFFALSLFLKELLQYYNHRNTVSMVMGGTLHKQVSDLPTDERNPDKVNAYIYKVNDAIIINSKEIITNAKDVETYFRPSDLPVLNDRISPSFFDKYYQKKSSEIVLPDDLVNTPEVTILNYFSVLREAANPSKGKSTGCGTIGNAGLPYPVAYNFLTTDYQKRLPYEQYLKTFENILHINLIKYKEIPVFDNTLHIIRYFIEIETIEGSDKHLSYFGYYYGYVDMMKEGNLYKISNIDLYEEDFLCAPYHGWSYEAVDSVQVRYGGWCSLIKELYPTKQNGYVKKIHFEGTDGNEYLIEFFQLTNDTDIEIAQYKKAKDGAWQLIQLDPENCLKDRNGE